MILLNIGHLNIIRSYLSNPNYTGDSIVDALVQIGVDASFENRKRLASLNGIDNYLDIISILNIFTLQLKILFYKKKTIYLFCIISI